MIFRRSLDVPALRDYRAYRDPYLRPDFQYRCAYCLTHEFYFLQGDGGEIDHHRPLNAEGRDFSCLRNDYANPEQRSALLSHLADIRLLIEPPVFER